MLLRKWNDIKKMDFFSRYFCDDDTLSIVGRHCRKLEYLKIQIIPEHAEEQQVGWVGGLVGWLVGWMIDWLVD